MKKVIYWLAAPLFTVFITVASMIANPAPPVNIDNVDKIYHATAYFIMAILWYIFFYSRFLGKQSLLSFGLKTILKNWSRPIAIGAGALSLIIGVLIELGQEFISVNRTMDIMDVLANFAGIIIAMLFLMIIDKLFNKHKVA
ncbi:VanZ family protein [Nonlabens sp. Asnod3-A02]|uniref:VanZ family protein n=1 Tax=Nonlabens sp. Asnod3-A02 TaxID=3160579 RepID=UPI00386A5B3E